MFGYDSPRATWKTKWGPEPVLALQEIATGDRRAPITLPGSAGALRRGDRRGQN